VYIIVGTLAARLAAGAGGATTDAHGALRAIGESALGKVALAVIGAGLLGYAVWRLIGAAADAEGKGGDAKGIAIRIGHAALRLGAGRRTTDDTIDHAVGVVCLKKRGDAVRAGETLAEVHARDDEAAAAGARNVLDAYELAAHAPTPRRIVLDLIA
jgi:hypothetical protein